jgi:AraC-like DNA-binding protein
MLDCASFMRESSEMSPDPLSDILELVHARCRLSGRLVAGGAWARRFANLNAIKICAATEGTCWHFMEGMPAPAPFTAGDVLVMSGTRSLVLASAPALLAGATTTPIEQDESGIYRLGRGGGFGMLGGTVEIDGHRQALLLDGLPPLMQVAGDESEAAGLGWLLGQITQEMEAAGKPGGSVALAQLAQLLFVHALRAYLASAAPGDTGWLKGLGDRLLTPALARMHAQPSRDWKLEELARDAGMSRTAFAVRFREVMGVPPLTYLTNWRMVLAERDLRSGASIADAADAVGYTSQSAFSNAFKRVMGIAPGECRKTSGHRHSGSEPLHPLDAMA